MPSSAIPSSVLLVEDHAIIAMNTETLLLDLGVREVKIAATLAAALALIAETTFDFAILDVRLGEQEDSLPVADQLVAAGVPIAFASGIEEAGALPDRYHGIAMLKKPYSFEDLEQLLLPNRPPN